MKIARFYPSGGRKSPPAPREGVVWSKDFIRGIALDGELAGCVVSRGLITIHPDGSVWIELRWQRGKNRPWGYVVSDIVTGFRLVEADSAKAAVKLALKRLYKSGKSLDELRAEAIEARPDFFARRPT